MNAVRPAWTGMQRLGDLPGLARQVVLHAGPPFSGFARIPAAVRNSLINMVIREGWAGTHERAAALLRSGSVAIEPAQDHAVFVPLAGAAGPSTMLIRVTDQASGQAAFSPINEGMALCTRLGILHPDLVDHLRWLDETLAPWLSRRLARVALPLFPILRSAIAREDDCHSRTMAGSEALVAALLGVMPAAPGDETILSFLQGAPAFALNVWMAMCGLIAAAAAGTEGSTLVTHAGGNGVDFGYRLAGDPGRWHLTPAPAIHGDIDPRFADGSPLPALGDSAIVDILGLGGQILASAAPVRVALAHHLPPDPGNRPLHFLHGRLDGFDGPAATDAAKVRAGGIGPVILLGMIDGAGRLGRVGGGCVISDAATFPN
jgi:hypothetical protein